VEPHGQEPPGVGSEHEDHKRPDMGINVSGGQTWG
jgi:hypothetical protein